MNGTRKILILGNGFDLAHFLPTKYEHFIHAMRVIEESPADNELSFNQLFERLIEEEEQHLKSATKKIDDSNINQELKTKQIGQLIENYFFHCTQKLYKTNEVVLSVEEVKDLKEKLQNNGWFQYFKDYLDSGIETWIDFENEMKTVLLSLCYLFSEIDNNPNILLLTQFTTLGTESSAIPYPSYISSKFFDTHDIKRNYPFLKSILIEFSIIDRTLDRPRKRFAIDSTLIKKYKNNHLRLDESKVFKLLEKQLDDFIEIFSMYIEFIESIKPKAALKSPKVLQSNLETLYSFNYSSTAERLYKLNGTHYLHGKAGEKKENKIVLGISELEHPLLTENKVYGFVKYYQKLVNNTDYQFLKPKSLISEIESRKIDGESKYEFWHPIEIYIWGHSLDSSDKDYIEEIFAFNRGENPSIRVVVYYYSSPHQQLANLIYILGKEIIEAWMKNDWLEFIKMPNIYKLNFEEGYTDHISAFSDTVSKPIKKTKSIYVAGEQRTF